MEKHTPGPWTLDECADAAGNSTIRKADGTPNGDIETCLATVYGDSDARLIAAAPDLLKALEAACEFLQDYRDNTGDSACLQVVQAAIQKARGEE